MKRTPNVKYLIGAGALLLLMAAAAFGVVLTVGYDVAADDPNNAPVV